MRPPQFLPIRVEMQGDERLYYQAHQQLMKLLLVEAHSTPCWPAQEQGPQPRRFAIRIQYPVQCCCALGTDAGGSAALPVPLGPLHLAQRFPRTTPGPHKLNSTSLEDRVVAEPKKVHLRTPP